MAVAFGLSPLEVERVADSSPAVLDAMREAAANRWTTDTELLAGIYEMTHTNARILAALAGVEPSDIPKAVRIPRPLPSTERLGVGVRRTATGPQLAAWVANRHRGGAT